MSVAAIGQTAHDRQTASYLGATVGDVTESASSAGTPFAPDWGRGPLRARRVMRVIGPLMGLVWVAFLSQPWQSAWSSGLPTAERTISLVAVALLALSFAYVVVTRAKPMARGLSGAQSAALLAAQLVLVALSCLAADEDGLVGLVFVCVSAVFLLRDPRALLFAVGSTVLILVIPRLIDGWDVIDSLVMSVVLATVAVFGFTQLVERNYQLQIAQDEVAVLAVERERERIARDMHDILGHSLTVVSVKAELAMKMLDVDLDRARAELAQVQALARSALTDVRGMVTATRAVTLPGEIAGAREAFEAAGIEAELPGSVDVVPDNLRELFAWAVREGTTNVLRHSGADRVRITMTADTLVVDDDGSGPCADSDRDPVENGLRGLGERAALVGARVRALQGPLGGFRLQVTAGKDDR